MHPYLDAPTPLAFAHRGGARAAPENSLSAFADAVSLGYRYLETDVRVTRDGVLVAFHDPTLDRVTDRGGSLADLDWAEVARASIAGREPIPRLEELLRTFPSARFNLDVKADAAVDPLADRLADLGVLDRVLVGSFSDERIQRLRERLGPSLCTSAGPKEVRRLRLASVVRAPAALAPVGAHCVQVPTHHRRIPLADSSMIDYCHRRGLQVHVWTVDAVPRMHALLDRGVDGLMTDDCRALRDVLRSRGQWHGAAA